MLYNKTMVAKRFDGPQKAIKGPQTCFSSGLFKYTVETTGFSTFLPRKFSEQNVTFILEALSYIERFTCSGLLRKHSLKNQFVPLAIRNYIEKIRIKSDDIIIDCTTGNGVGASSSCAHSNFQPFINVFVIKSFLH